MSYDTATARPFGSGLAPAFRPREWSAFHGPFRSWHPAARDRRDLSRKDLERFYLECCRAWQPGFPRGPVQALESPDFLVYGSDGITGVEVTEWHADHSRLGSRLRRDVEIRLRLVEQAEDLYYDADGAWARVDVFFAATPPHAESERMAHRLAATITQWVGQVPPAGRGEVPRPAFHRGLGRFIKRIRIARRERANRLSVWKAPSLGDPTAAIQAAVRHKETKLPLYRSRCDRAWLLVVASTSLASALPPAWPPSSFPSEFDKVLLLDFAGRRVVTL